DCNICNHAGSTSGSIGWRLHCGIAAEQPFKFHDNVGRLVYLCVVCPEPTTPMKRDIFLICSPEYPPLATSAPALEAESRARALKRGGHSVEVIARSDDEEEFMHLDDAGVLVHRIDSVRSYLFKSAGLFARGSNSKPHPLADAARTLEKVLELI